MLSLLFGVVFVSIRDIINFTCYRLVTAKNIGESLVGSDSPSDCFVRTISTKLP